MSERRTWKDNAAEFAALSPGHLWSEEQKVRARYLRAHPRAWVSWTPRWAFTCARCGLNEYIRSAVPISDDAIVCARCATPADHEACNALLVALPTGADPLLRTCEHCDSTFAPARSDARFCSTRCRVAAHRAARRASTSPTTEQR